MKTSRSRRWLACRSSDKLVIANHPMGFSRSGIPTYREPWRSVWQASGNDFDVNLVPDYKILHDAVYNILAYDLRNSGLSSAANGGIASSGISLDHVAVDRRRCVDLNAHTRSYRPSCYAAIGTPSRSIVDRGTR